MSANLGPGDLRGGQAAGKLLHSSVQRGPVPAAADPAGGAAGAREARRHRGPLGLPHALLRCNHHQTEPQVPPPFRSVRW